MIKVFRLIDNIETNVADLSLKNATYKHGIMSLDEVQISVTTDKLIDVIEGDYIKHNDIIYTLNRDAEFTIENDVKYSYDLIFEHPQYTLLNKLIAHRVSGLTSFTLMGKLADFVQLIVWNMNKTIDNPTGVDNGWSIGYCEDTEYKLLTLNDINCREGLKMLAQEFGCEYYFVNDGKRINFVYRYENVTDYIFEQGKGVGLYKLTQQNVDKEDTVTRAYVRGGSQNVPIENADEEGYLKLPENYLENFSEHSKVVERKITFEEEFPHFIGVVESVSGDNNKTITCTKIDFDIKKLAVGDNARINFLSGDLMGNSFEFAWDNTKKEIKLIEKTDDVALPDSNGQKPPLPSPNKKAKLGDEFNFTGLIMPKSYVDASIARLREKGQKWLGFYSKKRVKYAIDIDYRWLREKKKLNIGDLVVLSIPQKSFYKAIRITHIEENLSTGAISAVVSNYLEDNWEKYNEYQIGVVKNQILELQENIKVVDGIMYRDRGIWSSDTATTKPYLCTATIVDDVWNLGNKWRCKNNKTTQEPRWSSSDWQMIEGRSDARMEIEANIAGGLSGRFEDYKLTPIVYIGHTNVSADIVPEQWTWTRESGDAVADAIWNKERENNGRILVLSHVDMGANWSVSNPIKLICTATYPASSINKITAETSI